MGEKSEKITLHCGDRVFTMNKKLLCSRSLYFNTMFQCGLQESLSNEVTVNDISPEVLEFVLHYIDSKKFPADLDEDLLLETLSASHMLMVDGLTDECSRQVVVTESNYSTILKMNEMYRNVLIENILKFQAKHFRENRTALLSRSYNDLKFLLINTTIGATVDEIIEFLLAWAKTNKEHVKYLSELFSLVDLSSISDESLNKYSNDEPLICENLDIKNALKEKAALDQLHFSFCNKKEFQTYCVKTKQWSPVYRLPKKFNSKIAGIFFVKDDYYVIDRRPHSMVVIKLSPDLTRIVSRKYLNIKLHDVFVKNNTFWFVSCSIHLYDPVTEELRIIPNMLPKELDDYEWYSMLVDENHIFVSSHCSFLDINLDLCTRKEVSYPPLTSNFMMTRGSCGDQFYVLVFHEYIETLEFNKLGEETKEDFLKSIEGRRYRRYCISFGHELYKTYSPHLKIFKLLPDNTWEKIVLENFCFCPELSIMVHNLMNRKISFIYFRSKDGILQMDTRNYEWQKIVDSIPKKYFQISAFFKKVL